MRRRFAALLLAAGSLVPAACGSNETTTGATTTVATTTVATTAPPSTAVPTTIVEDTMPEPTDPQPTAPKLTVPNKGGATTIPVPAAPADDDIARLTEHVRILVDDPEAAVTVVSSKRVTWRDGALGCPEPGGRYTQALVEGARTILEHEGTQYSYHRGNGDWFYCANPSSTPLDDT